MFTREQALKIQKYYWDSIEPFTSGLYDENVRILLKKEFDLNIGVDDLEALAYGDYSIDIEDVLYELENDGVSSMAEVHAVEILSEEPLSIIYCAQCNRYYNAAINSYIEYCGEIFCEDCVENSFYRCYECGEYVHEEDVTWDGNGEAYCQDCADEDLHYCGECGEYYTEDNTIRDRDCNSMCTSCFENNYHLCDDCGCFVDRYDANHTDNGTYCNRCFESYEIIRSYNYKPAPLFYGSGNRYLGVELEVDDGGTDEDNAQTILDILEEQHAYCKHDGSINDGFEIVSHPATIDYHMRCIDWGGALQELRNLDYTSHDAGTCGIHVHMNRGGFGDTLEEQELGISKVLFFIERHWVNVVKFSRRSRNQLDRWAARYLSGTPEHPEDVLDYAKNDMSRYRCVNLRNYSTVEIRVFRGSLIYETFMATLQFADLMYDIAELPLDDVMDITWNEFTDMGSKYEEFTSYIKRRNLRTVSSTNIVEDTRFLAV